MGTLDSLNSGMPAGPTSTSSVGMRTETFTFEALPENLSQMQALPEADLRTPFRTAALTVCALCACTAEGNSGVEMLNWLRDPRPLTGQDISFLNDRFHNGRAYIPFSYFAGAVPENDYTPGKPYTVSVSSDHNSGAEQGYMTLFVYSGGADSPRTIRLRMNADGRWSLWEQYLLSDIKPPNSAAVQAREIIRNS